MTTAVPDRFTTQQIKTLSQLVGEGIGETRSAVIRRADEHVAAGLHHPRGRAARVIALSGC